MPKRRFLNPGQEVLILYRSHVGFVEQTARFIEYRPISINDVTHSTPVFESDGKKITGLECFWVLPDEINHMSIQRLQRDIIQLQLRAIELANALEYKMPIKVTDPQIKDAAEQMVEKLGYDPRDESWLETDMAQNDRERNWFKFERENSVGFYQLLYASDWTNIVRLFNDRFHDNVSIEDAKQLSSKRMRYVMGSTPIRLAGVNNPTEWKKQALEFEKEHKETDDRMNAWSESRNGKFPLVKTKAELPFNPGPYFNECLERIPQYFSATDCKRIKAGSILRLISYDPKHKYVRLDFPEEIRKQIKPDETGKPWISDGGDYLIFITRQDVGKVLEFLDGFAV